MDPVEALLVAEVLLVDIQPARNRADRAQQQQLPREVILEPWELDHISAEQVRPLHHHQVSLHHLLQT